MIALLLSLSLAHAGPTERAEKLIAKGKPDVAARKLSAWLYKHPDEDAPEIQAVLSDAVWAAVQAEPTLAGASRFLQRYPRHDAAPAARTLAAELALEQARQLGTESALLGVARQYAGEPAAATAQEEAAAMSHGTLSGETPIALRRFLLRYPASSLHDDVAAQELQLAYAAAEAAGTTAGWRRLLEHYPEHPRLDEVLSELEEVAWSELQQGEPDAADLWQYAADFDGTGRGWEAAERGLAGAITLTDPAVIDAPLDTLSFSLAAPPPPGTDLDLSVEVDLGSGWLPWSAAAAALAAPLGLGAVAPEEELVLAGSTMRWTSTAPLCVASGEAPLRVTATLSREGDQATWTDTRQLQATCPGSRQLVFLELGDDLNGPIAFLQRDPTQGTWAVEPIMKRLPQKLECTHLTALDEQGAVLSCGPAEARVGWDGKVWLRQTDPALRSTSRVALSPLPTGSGLVARGDEVIGPTGRLDRGAAGRALVSTPPDLTQAHGGYTQPHPLPLDPADERPGGRLPMPEAATELNLRSNSPDTQTWNPRIMAMGLGMLVPTRQLSVEGGGRLEGAFIAGRGAIGMMLVPADDGWHQVISLPVTLGNPERTRWSAFSVDGESYLRAASAQGQQTLHTLYWDGTGYTLAETTLP